MRGSTRCVDAAGRSWWRVKRSYGFLESAALSRHPRGPADRPSRFVVSASIVDPRLDGRPVRRVVYSAEQIAERVRQLGSQITQMYPEGDLLVLGLLKGSFIFLSDLVRSVTRPLQVDFLVAASYGDQMESTGNVRLVYDPETGLEGKHILLVEDIVDSGRTLSRLMDLLTVRDPRSLDICALLHKHVDTHLRYPVKLVGFDAPNEFLVGYGLDHAENFRHLPYIASLQ
jgi:hypoxanthine phosphoribosyltransferase